MLILLAALGILALAHLAPFPFLLDVTDHTIWSMPETPPPTVYLTFDDGPNPRVTPTLLDALDRHGAKATFFILDKYISDDTTPILRRAIAGGHALALHSDTPSLLFKRPSAVARRLERSADRLEKATGAPPCRAFRPHAGARSVPLIKGASQAGYTVVGWGFMLWDFNWGKRRTADDLVPRFSARASAGDIIVIHDGHHRRPEADRHYAVEIVDRLVPALQARGLRFGTICEPGSNRPAIGETGTGELRQPLAR